MNEIKVSESKLEKINYSTNFRITKRETINYAKKSQTNSYSDHERAGRDFHNFNMVYRDDPNFEVVAFTAAQIPGISGRRYPPSLTGEHYPDGVPILNEDELAVLCREEDIDEVVFAYSDIEHASVMHKASIALASGADFKLLGPKSTMITAEVPVISHWLR